MREGTADDSNNHSAHQTATSTDTAAQANADANATATATNAAAAVADGIGCTTHSAAAVLHNGAGVDVLAMHIEMCAQWRERLERAVDSESSKQDIKWTRDKLIEVCV